MRLLWILLFCGNLVQWKCSPLCRLWPFRSLHSVFVPTCFSKHLTVKGQIVVNWDTLGICSRTGYGTIQLVLKNEISYQNTTVWRHERKLVVTLREVFWYHYVTDPGLGTVFQDLFLNSFSHANLIYTDLLFFFSISIIVPFFPRLFAFCIYPGVLLYNIFLGWILHLWPNQSIPFCLNSQNKSHFTDS